MRLWSIHPRYLDSKGLVALWREGLLAQNVLMGKTKGYVNHPQLDRFKVQKNPDVAIGSYLKCVYEEAQARHYNFQESKIIKWSQESTSTIPVPRGQVAYEFEHLKAKLKVRDPKKYSEIKDKKQIQLHPIFKRVAGGIADWEKVQL